MGHLLLYLVAGILIWFLVSWLMLIWYLRRRNKRYRDVFVTDKNGEKRTVRIKPGRDPEIDALISKLKNKEEQSK